MKIKRITFSILIITILPVGIVLWAVSYLNPGVDTYAKYYQINAEEKTLIQAIEEFKKENLIYCVPEYYDAKDSREDRGLHRYDVYFYYKEEECVIHCWTHPSGIKKTTFALVATKMDKWRQINKDLDDDESQRQTKLFEARILNPIKSKLSAPH